MEILATTPVEEFKLKTVAQQLGTVSMAIYNYFGSREELLMEVANQVWLLFKPPKPGETWQATVLAWLWAIKKHADRYPVIPSIVGINGHSSPGWIKITAPMVTLMYEQLGLRGRNLALASYLFCSTAADMIYVVKSSHGYRQPDAFPSLDGLALDRQQRMVIETTQTYILKLKEKEIFDALFAQLIKGIEVFL